jgi:Protein of unknown function, DUF547
LGAALPPGLLADEPVTIPNAQTQGDPCDPNRPEDTGQGMLFSYTALDCALVGRVDKTGNVNYAALKGDKNLERFVRATGKVDLSLFPTWKLPVKEGAKPVGDGLDHSAELTFLINAYNAHVVKTVADAYPLESVDQIKDFDTAPTHLIAGKKWSFRDLRKKIIGLDRRAAFVLTDATRGGPPLVGLAYRFDLISPLLTKVTHSFINDVDNVELLRIRNVVTVNPFFMEVEPLFVPPKSNRKWDGVRELLKGYTESDTNRKYFITGDYEVKFKQPNRKLNDAKLAPKPAPVAETAQ